MWFEYGDRSVVSLGVHPTAFDRVRSIGLGVAAASMILVPTLGPVVAGTEEGAEEFDTEITPPRYAFAIWAPIFAGVAVNAVQHTARPARPVNRHTGWWLAAAYAANTAWSIAAQSGRFRRTPFILPVAAGLAFVGYRRAQGEEASVSSRIVANSTGLLFGWTSVASVVNAFAVPGGGRPSTTTRAGRTLARLAVVAAAAGISTIIGASRHGRASVAAASGWALATSAADPRRRVATRLTNLLGSALIARSAVSTSARRRTKRRSR